MNKVLFLFVGGKGGYIIYIAFYKSNVRVREINNTYIKIVIINIEHPLFVIFFPFNRITQNCKIKLKQMLDSNNSSKWSHLRFIAASDYGGN